MALPPGFRFHPTDEELVAYYLRRKVGGRPIEFNIIVEIDLYKQEPWDLPEKSVSYGSDMEWYFFSPRDKKYPNGLRTNRATEAGYWKATGKDRNVKKAGRNIGMKKTLVFYLGRAPHGERTDWVMHEYRLNEEDCEKVHAAQCHHFVSLPKVAKSMNIRHVHHVDASSEEDPPHLHELFVLCRVFKKSGVGPRSGDDRGPQTYVDDDIDREPCGSFAEAVKKALEPGTVSTSAIALAPEETPTVAPTGSSPTSAPSVSVGDYAPSEEAGDTIVKSTSVPFGEYILDEPSFSENDDGVQQFWDCFPSITGELDLSTFTDGSLEQLSAELFGTWQGDRDASTPSGMIWSSDLKSNVQPQQQPQQDEGNFGVESSEMLQLELLKTDDVLPPLEEELESGKPRNQSEACSFSPNYCENENQMLRGHGPARASERVAQQQPTSEEAQQRACSSNDGLNRCEAAPQQRMSNINFSGPEVPSEGGVDSASLNVMCPAPRGSPSINFDTNQLPSSSDPTPSASARGIGIAGVPEDSLYSFQDSFLEFPVEDDFNSGPQHDDNGFSFAVQHELVGEQGNSREPPPPDESVKLSKSAVSEGPPSLYWSTQGHSEKTRPSGLMKLLDSLSVLPASAAECPPDMMPVQKNVQVGSTFSSVHLSTVTVTCTSSVDGAQKVQAAVIDCRLQGDAQGVYQEVVSASWQTMPVEKAGTKEGSESQKPLCANCDTAAASGVLQRRVARGSNSGFVFVFGLGAVSALCWFLLLGGMWRIASHVFSCVF